MDQVQHQDGERAVDEIAELVRSYARGFAGEPAATVAHYALPMIFVGADTVAVLDTREQAIDFVSSILCHLHPTGFDHTTVESCDVRLLKQTVAICAVAGTRRRADGGEIERIGATYVLTAHPDWRIREIIATDPDNVGLPQA